MNFQEIAGFAVPILVTLLLSVGAVIGFGLMLHVGQGVQREPLPWMFLMVAVVVVIGPITSGRNLSGLSVVFESDLETAGSWLWATRIVNVLVLLFSVERITRQVFSKSRDKVSGWPLYLAFLCFVVTNSVINGIWGTVPQLSHLTLYPIVATLAITMMAPREWPRLIWFAKTAVLGMLILSLVVAVISPSTVIQQGYTDGFLPIRYWGLGSHANTISPLMVCMMACLWHQPYHNAWLNRSAWILGLVSLILTQSKTAMLAFMFVMAILIFYRYRDSIPSLKRTDGMRTLATAALMAFMFLLIVILVVQVVFDLSYVSELLRGTRAGSKVATFSNRDQIWRYAFQEWHANPWFGYGPLIFEAQYRLMIGLSQAYHAHNQFMQSLSSAGNVGVLGLLVFTATLSVYAWRASAASSGLSLALLVFILIRMVTEVPLSLRGVANNEYFFLMVLFAVCVACQPSRLAPQRASNHAKVVSKAIAPLGS